MWLFRLDQQKEEEQIVRISRDETLSRLPVRVQSGRIVELVQLRDSSRPVRQPLCLLGWGDVLRDKGGCP